MTEDQVKFVQRPKRSWREPSPVERLEIIRKQIALNDEKPTDSGWLMRDGVLRDRESILMAEIAKLKTLIPYEKEPMTFLEAIEKEQNATS